MPIHPNAPIGVWNEWATLSWSSRDSLLYAVGVGANPLGDGSMELEFTTENTGGVRQRALPTLPMAFTALDQFREVFDSAGSFDLGNMVDGRRRIDLHREIPVEGTMRYRSRLVGIYDKTSGAVLAIETESRDASNDERLYNLHSEFFVRGEGGFGGDRGLSGPRNIPPDRPADYEIRYETQPNQALVFRLSGDRGRLHSDPFFARAFGFERPILHGLCTYGYTARALLHALCNSDPAHLKSIEGRFVSVVYPGDSLTVSIWADGDKALFTTRRQSGEIVLDQGLCTFTS